MKSWARDLALGLLLATAIPIVPAYSAQTAEEILLDKAKYWRLKDRPDLAIEALQKLLSINPNAPDALYQYGIIEVQQNRLDDAKGYLARLQKAAPSSPRVADLENAIRAGQVSPNELNEARRLAQAGQFAQATEKYQQTFKGAPPPTFGVEYYMTLAGTPQGWTEARRGLGRLVQESPNDSKARLALAEVLTYHAETRAEGIRSLQQLSSDPVVGAQAVQSWRKATLWLGGSPADRQLYAQYLAKYPQDTELRAHVTEAEKPGPAAPRGPASASAVGYGDLNRGNLGAAERQFEAQLRANPNNADAIAGLGLIRLRQQRFGEARDDLSRAMHAAPGRSGQWASAYESAVFWSNVNAAKAAQNAGNYAEAEAGFRRALAAQPNNADAIVGLYSALSAEGKGAEAATLAARIASIDPGKMAGINRARSDILRADGKSLMDRNDIAGAQAKYQEAIAVDPSNGWARLDLARIFATHGDAAQAFAVINPNAAGVSVDSLQAAAIFYSEQNRMPEALAALDRIPSSARNAEVTAFRDRILVTAEIARAKQLAQSGNRAAARNVLLSLNSRPPVTPERTRMIADALADLGDTQAALQIARPNPATAGTNKKAVLDYASLLFRSGRDGEATAYLAQAEANGRITASDRSELEHIKGDIAARRADQLRERGDYAGAYDQISSLLNAYPNDPTLLLAAGRIYAAAGQNSVAMRFFDAGYRQSPSDLGVIRGAVGGAIMAGDLYRARVYLAQGMQAHPNNPRLVYLQAEIARAGGDNGSALYDLKAARSLDMQQAGGYQALPGGPPIMAPGAPSALPPNPFRQSQAAPQPAPTQIGALQDEVQPVGNQGRGSQPVGLRFASQQGRAAGHFQLAAATGTDAPMVVPATLKAASPSAEPEETTGPSTPPPLQDTAVSADSDDLIVPPHVNERPTRRLQAVPAVAPVGIPSQMPGDRPQLASLPAVGDSDLGAGSSDAGASAPASAPRRQLAELPPLPPPPLPAYQSQGYGARTYQASAYQAPAYQAPGYQSQAYQNSYYAAAPQPQGGPALAPLPPPPVQGYQPPAAVGQSAPIPQDSLELDIERSMAAISAESAPVVQGGLGFRVRSGEDGLSRLDEFTLPLEGSFSPLYTGTLRLQAIPTYLTAGSPDQNALLRFGNEPLIALNGAQSLSALTPARDQTASGVSLNAAYSYRIFSGEIGSTPLGFPVENFVGRLALTWPGSGANSTALPNIPLPPQSVANPLQVKVEAARQPITDSLLSYAGTRDPVTGHTWGGAIKTGGDGLVSYDDGDIGIYAGGGYWSIDGTSIANNTEMEGLVGAYVRPYRVGNNAFKIGINLSYMGYDKNLRFFTFGQGGYFSPQNYLNVGIPMEYAGRSGRFAYLIGGSLGVQTFNEDRSPVFPTQAGNQAALQNAFGPAAFYSSRSVTGISFGARGQLEYQLDNGFTVGGLASVDNAQNYTEAIGKVYLRKTFGASPPAAAYLPNSLPGRL
ncbi:MAG TPA: cellulose synthase subunit BcsC-related outer membrane protein [Stellaceae bacterium]|jgi:tetratricopeptide (TPR) repeat protein|nr:cellulose synthase subunit BcsC-related outer membrane protein [Stellaceae bacterium]